MVQDITLSGHLIISIIAFDLLSMNACNASNIWVHLACSTVMVFCCKVFHSNNWHMLSKSKSKFLLGMTSRAVTQKHHSSVRQFTKWAYLSLKMPNWEEKCCCYMKKCMQLNEYPSVHYSYIVDLSKCNCSQNT